MNQIFSFKRYFLLLKRQWFENAAIYKWGIVLMIAATLLSFWMFTNWKAIENPHLGQMETFSVLGLFFFYIFGSNFFDSLSSKHKGMFYFSLPVSSLERIGVAFTSVMIILPFIFLVIFFVSDFLFVQLFNHVHDASEQMFFVKTSPLKQLSFVSAMTWAYLSFTSIYVLGSLVFGKSGMFISTVISFIFLFGFFWLWAIIYGSKISIIDFFNSLIFPLIIPLCWSMMYFCMKRKEV